MTWQLDEQPGDASLPGGTWKPKHPRPWPENTWPTPEQFADWFTTAPRIEQLLMAKRILADAQLATECFIRNHRSMEHEVAHLSARLNRYRLAWRSARRNRIHPERLLRGLAQAREALHTPDDRANEED